MAWRGSEYSQGAKNTNRDQTIYDEMFSWPPYKCVFISFDAVLKYKRDMKVQNDS